MILNPTKEIIRKYTKKLIDSAQNHQTRKSKIQQRPETRKNKENSTSTTNQHKNQEKHMKSKIKLTTLKILW